MAMLSPTMAIFPYIGEYMYFSNVILYLSCIYMYLYIICINVWWLDKREAVEWSGSCSSVGRLRYPIWEMNVSTDQWKAAIGLFYSHSITTSCVGIRIDLVFILNWFYNITRLLKPPLVSDLSNYPLRNNSNYSVPHTRTEVSHRSCVLQCLFGIISMKLFVTPVQSIHLKTMLSLCIPIYKLFHHIILRVIESYQLYMHA